MVVVYGGAQPFVIAATIETHAEVVDSAEEVLTVTAAVTADGYVVRVVSVTPTATFTLTAVASTKRPTYLWNGSQYVSVQQMWVKSVGEWLQPIAVWSKTDSGWRKVWDGDER